MVEEKTVGVQTVSVISSITSGSPCFCALNTLCSTQKTEMSPTFIITRAVEYGSLK